MAGFAPAPLPHLSLVLEEVVTGSSGEAAFLPHVGLVFEPNQFTLTCEAGSYALTGQDAALWYVPITANAGDPAPLPHLGLVLSGGFDGIIADPGAFTVTGVSENLRVVRKVVAAAGSFSLTGQDATLSYTVNSVEFPAPLPHLSLVLTGVEGVYGLPAASGAFTLTGQDAATRKGVGVIAATGSFLWTGAPALRDLQLTAEQGQFDLISVGASLVASHLPITAEAGAFVVTGYAAGLEYSGVRSMLGASGSFLVDPGGATMYFGRAVQAGAAEFTLSGQAASYSTTGTFAPPETQGGGIGGKSRKRRKHVLEVDGKYYEVSGANEAKAILAKLRRQAKKDAVAAIKKASSDSTPEPPQITLQEPDYSDSWVQQLQAQIDAANAAIAEMYRRIAEEAEQDDDDEIAELLAMGIL